MTAERYQWKLSRELLAKAVADVHEPDDDQARLAEIDKLKRSFEEKYPGVNLTRSDDEFLLRFLRSCKYDQEHALKTLGCYHKLRKEWSDVFERFEDKSTLEGIFKEGAVLSLPDRAKDGSFIIVKRPGLGLGRSDPIEIFVASVFLSYEKLLENEETQIYGFTVIADMSHLGVRLGMKFASIGRRFIKMLQEVLPIQVKGLNVVNEAFAFDIVFAVVSRFMNNALREKIKLHKHDLTGLQEVIDKGVLPPSLGGSGPEENAESWANEVLA